MKTSDIRDTLNHVADLLDDPELLDEVGKTG
jgi:hypothetical protein